MTSSRFCFPTVAVALVVLTCFRGLPAQADLLVDSKLLTSPITGQILRYDQQTGTFIDVFIDTRSGGFLGSYGGMVIGPEGNLYVTKDGEVQRYDVTTGALLGVFVPPDSGGLIGPGPLSFGPDGNLYVRSSVPVGSSDDSILRYNGATGAFLGVFVPPTGNPISGEAINDFVFGPDGNLYAAVSGGNVLRYNGATGELPSVSSQAVSGAASLAWTLGRMVTFTSAIHSVVASSASTG